MAGPAPAPQHLLQAHRGCLVLGDCGMLISAETRQLIERRVPSVALRQRIARDGLQHHITVALPSEWAAIPGCRGKANVARVIADAAALGLGTVDDVRASITIHGLGTARRGREQCWFLVLDWPKAAAWRASHGLPPRDFHITVGFLRKDIHGVCKNQATLIEAALQDQQQESKLMTAYAPVGSAQTDKQQHELAAALSELVTSDHLTNFIESRRKCFGDPNPRNPVQMRDFLRAFRADVLQRISVAATAQTRIGHACKMMLMAKRGSSTARALTLATKEVVARWVCEATTSTELTAGVDLLRTLSDRTRAAAMLAREREAIAQKEEAALDVTLAQVELEILQCQSTSAVRL